MRRRTAEFIFSIIVALVFVEVGVGVWAAAQYFSPRLIPARLLPLNGTSFCGEIVGGASEYLVSSTPGSVSIWLNDEMAPIGLAVPNNTYAIVQPILNATRVRGRVEWLRCVVHGNDLAMNVTNYEGAIGSVVPLGWSAFPTGSNFTIAVSGEGTRVRTGDAVIILTNVIARSGSITINMNGTRTCWAEGGGVYINNKIVDNETGVMSVGAEAGQVITIIIPQNCSLAINMTSPP